MAHRTASNFTAKFVSTVFATVLAGANFSNLSGDTARADDSCLAAPKGVAPNGGHWFYHLDRATKRQCWYVRDGGSKQALMTPQDRAGDTATSPDHASLGKSVANARAELQPSQTTTPPSMVNSVAPANVLPTRSQDTSKALDTSSSPSIVSSRWLAPTSMASAEVTPTIAPSAKASPSVAAQAPVVPPASSAVAAPTPSNLSSSIQTIMMILIGALAFAGVAGGIIFRFGKSRLESGLGGHASEPVRRPIWDMTPIRQEVFAETEIARRPNIGAPRELREATDHDDRIADMLTRLARSAQA